MKKVLILLAILVFSVSVFSQNSFQGLWMLTSMTDENGATVSLPEKFNPSIRFEEKKFGARFCNHISGNYSVNKKSIKFVQTRTTAMACPELKTELLYSKNLKTVTSFSVEKDTMTLSNNEKIVLNFRKMFGQKGVILNGKWHLVSMTLGKDNDLNVSGKPITFNINNNQASGNGGCNWYSGKFLQSEVTVKFSKSLSTKKFCKNVPTERQYLQALEKVVSYQFKNGQLVLTDEGKNTTLIFKEVR